MCLSIVASLVDVVAALHEVNANHPLCGYDKHFIYVCSATKHVVERRAEAAAL